MTSAPARAASSAVARNSEWATYRTLIFWSKAAKALSTSAVKRRDFCRLLILDRYRNASDDQRHRVAHRGHLLIQPALLVLEPARERGRGYDAGTDFVRHEQDIASIFRKPLQKCRALLAPSP